jgi:hypothetical protein
MSYGTRRETEQSCSERFPGKVMKQVLRDERTAARTEPDDLLRMENHKSESYNVGEFQRRAERPVLKGALKLCRSMFRLSIV